ncbi:hypothetical protein [Candidatus Villigracilis saccharophilus]|uniref:hypothetical protein n=1 Tax=Candidatus Villigracilis saccharophilus TaxID=3140684 RepID=UPI0031357FE0|nr:hypothetical protein [Anaerolineales bacterium]
MIHNVSLRIRSMVGFLVNRWKDKIRGKGSQDVQYRRKINSHLGTPLAAIENKHQSKTHLVNTEVINSQFKIVLTSFLLTYIQINAGFNPFHQPGTCQLANNGANQ